MDALSFGKQDKGKQGAVILEEDLTRRYKEGASCSAKGTHSSGGAGIQVHGVNPAPGAFPFPWESVPGWEVQPLVQLNNGERMGKNCPEYKVSLQSPVACSCTRLLACF